MLIDPVKAEFLDIELSRAPVAKPVPDPPQNAEGEVLEPHQINPLHRFMPRVPLLWLHAWILWLADIVVRFFPVVA